MLVKLGGGTKAAVGLVDLLLECHGRIREFLTLARRAAEESALPPGECVEACARVERYFRQALPLHAADEEQSLEPRLAGKRADVDAALAQMKAEHRQHDAQVEALLAACVQVQRAPEDAEGRANLGRCARELQRSFDVHLEREERILFPALRQLLSPEAEAEVLLELRARRQS